MSLNSLLLMSGQCTSFSHHSRASQSSNVISIFILVDFGVSHCEKMEKRDRAMIFKGFLERLLL